MVSEVESNPQWAQMGGRKNTEKVGYYRLKSGWITASDTQASKMQVMMIKGAQFLPQYPEVKSSDDYWGPILRHPTGPAEFPVEQILAYRWYRPEYCPVRGVTFPQLAGIKITEFPCPECSRLPFHTAIHLGTHLRVMHDYDRSEVLKYGEAMNIDFSKVPGGREVIEYDFSHQKVEQAAKEVMEESAFELATVSAATPATEEIKQEAETERKWCDACDWQPKSTTINKEHALNLHRQAKHRTAEPVQEELVTA